MEAWVKRLPIVRIVGVCVVLASVLAVFQTQPAQSASMSMSMSMSSAHPMNGMSMQQRFDYLSHQTTNNCMLLTAGFASMNPTLRLQGACCGPMVYADYVKQISEIAIFNRARGTGNVIPSDPYNMSVGFVRKLDAYNDTILLTQKQQKVYDDAFKYSPDKAPCCCHCYRWTAFEGQAKFLIARRRYTAQEIGTIWGFDDGCGSSSAGGSMSGMGMG